MSRCVALLCGLQLLVAPAQPPFRASTDVVRMDVLVEQNGRPVANLTAADFIVRDNDVVQRVTLLPHVVPLSVAAVLDVSGSITSGQIADAALATDALRNGLAPEDRLHAFAFAADARPVSLENGNDTPAALQALASELRQAAGGQTAFFDALQMAILNGAGGDESRLLVALTDGRDNMSWVDARAAMEAAQRRGVALCFVALPPSVRTGPAEIPPVVGDVGLRLLRVLAERTGGRVVHPDRSTPLGPVFEALLRDHRQRYILAFEPTGVAKGDGWHRVTAAVKRRGARIHVRDGYWSR